MAFDFFKPRKRRNEPTHGRFACLDCGAEWGEPVTICTACGAVKRTIPIPLSSPAPTRLAPLKSAAELRKTRRGVSWSLGKDWEWLGRLPKTFDMLVWGEPGGGKSSLVTLLADAMALACESPVLYIAAEEGTGDALLARLERLEVITPHLMVSSAVSWQEMSHDIDQSDPAAIVLDSISYAQVTEGQLRSLKETRPVPLVITAHATKDGHHAGSAGLAHWVDVVVRVTSGTARSTKNRFGALAEHKIFSDSA